MNAALNLEAVAASWAETQNACESGEVHAARQVPPYEARNRTRLGVFQMGKFRTTALCQDAWLHDV
jgi:hypothetical protein